MFTPKFTITNKILKNIGSIEASKEVIDKAPLLPYYEKEFQNDAIVRTVHFGTHIEGNELNLSQAQRVLEGQEVTARERDVQEVINYRKAMEYIQIKNQKSKIKIDENTIKEMHEIIVQKILPKEQSGVYRKTQVVVKNSKTGEVSFKPPMAIAIPFQIKDLLEFV